MAWGSVAQWFAHLLRYRAVPGLIPHIPESFSWEKNGNVAEVNQRRCLEKSEQWLEKVDQAHRVISSGKLVLQ